MKACDITSTREYAVDLPTEQPIVCNESGPGYWMPGFGCLRAEGENRPSRPGHLICFAQKSFGISTPTIFVGSHRSTVVCRRYCIGRIIGLRFPLPMYERAYVFVKSLHVWTKLFLTTSEERTRRIQEEALEQAEAALKKAQTMTALEEAAVKALTGEGSMDLQFINSLIPKRRANLENALGDVERLRGELTEIERAEQAASRELKMILSWAETLDAASRETRCSIIALLIHRVVVYADDRPDIHFHRTAEQYLEKASCKIQNNESPMPGSSYPARDFRLRW